MPPLLARHLLLRGLVLWFLVRVAFAMALLLVAQPSLAANAAVLSGVVALTAGLAFVDLSYRGELVLVGNLGVAPHVAVWTCAAPAAVAELALLLVLR